MPDETPIDLEEYRGLHPADLADRLQRLPIESAQAVFHQLEHALAAGALAEMEPDKAGELLQTLSTGQIVKLFQELADNAVADLAASLPPDRRHAVLTGLPEQKARAITGLLAYPPDTAGGIMSDRFIAIRPEQTVGECHETLRARAEPASDEVSYLYVTDDHHRLVGILPLRDLVFRRPERRIADIMNPQVKVLRVNADQEEIAREFEHYHYLALPVVDETGRLRGIVRASDALDIARAEATEDMQLMVGLSGEERALTPWRKSIGRRLPWLYINLLTAFAAAAVVGVFESTIAKWTALAIFLPIIAGQGGNAAMQTLTIIVRDMALGELSPGDGRKALAKEMTLGLINGLAVGLVVGLVGYCWKGSLTLGIVAMVAMVLNQLAAALSGVAIPFGLKALKIDPALASSIFVTTVTDVAGFFFFLGLAMLALRWAGG